jgi:hypothetical protein
LAPTGARVAEAAPPTAPRPQTVTQTANTASEAYAFLNTNAAGGGLTGQVGPSVYANAHSGLTGIYNAAGSTVGYGVFGLSTTGFGVYGRSTSTQYGGVYGTAFNNGVVGVSTGRTGVFGQTTAANNVPYSQQYPFDSSTYDGHAGVAGNDASVAPTTNNVNENVGVYGLSQFGLAGVLGVLGQASSGSTAGVLGFVSNGSQEGVFGRDQSSGTTSSGLFGSSRNGTGTTTFSTVYSGADIGLEVDNATLNTVPALLVQGDVQTATYPLVIVRNNFDSSTPDDVFSIGGSGNVVAQGTITGSASPLAVTRASDGTKYVAYGMRASAPSIEDVGFANLSKGYAVVKLDPSFAKTLDARTPYAVFLSPEGDNKGLYVTAKTGTSFVVRESQSGTSSLPFSYRIVARPGDMPSAPHLPDARTLVQPIFDDRKERAMHAVRKAERERMTRLFATNK